MESEERVNQLKRNAAWACEFRGVSGIDEAERALVRVDAEGHPLVTTEELAQIAGVKEIFKRVADTYNSCGLDEWAEPNAEA